MTLVEFLELNPSVAINGVPRHVMERWIALWPDVFSDQRLDAGEGMLRSQPRRGYFNIRFWQGKQVSNLVWPYVTGDKYGHGVVVAFGYQDIVIDESISCVEDADFDDEIKFLL